MLTSLQRQRINLAHIFIKELLKPNAYFCQKSGFPTLTRWSKKPFGSAFLARLPFQAPTLHLSHSIKMTQLPCALWKEVAMEFLDPFPNGEYLLVVIYEFSRLPDVKILQQKLSFQCWMQYSHVKAFPKFLALLP